MSAPPPRARRRPRTVVLAALAALLVAVGVVALVVVTGGGGRSAGAAAAPGSLRAGPAAEATVPPPLPTPAPSGPTGDADQGPASLPPVPLHATATTGNGISGVLEKVEAIDGTGTGPGNVSGPALRVTIRLDNHTATPVPLGGVAVQLAYGADQTPASPLDDPSTAPLGGMLAGGRSATGVYVFTVPRDSRQRVDVSVEYQAGAPFLVFTGSAP